MSCLSRYFKCPPNLTAQALISHIDEDGFEVSVVDGFINFRIGEKIFIKIVDEILDKKENYAKSNKFNKKGG